MLRTCRFLRPFRDNTDERRAFDVVFVDGGKQRGIPTLPVNGRDEPLTHFWFEVDGVTYHLRLDSVLFAKAVEHA